MAITPEEVAESEQVDDFFQIFLATNSKDSQLEEGYDGNLSLLHRNAGKVLQISFPKILRPRVLQLSHYALMSGYPVQTIMLGSLRFWHYWPSVSADVKTTLKNCDNCARNRIGLKSEKNTMKIFPAIRPL